MAETFDIWFHWFASVQVGFYDNSVALTKTCRKAEFKNHQRLVPRRHWFAFHLFVGEVIGSATRLGKCYSRLLRSCTSGLFSSLCRVYWLIPYVQDQKSIIECQVSKAHFQEVNILGADAMQYLKLSIMVNWDLRNFKLIKQWMFNLLYSLWDWINYINVISYCFTIYERRQ